MSQAKYRKAYLMHSFFFYREICPTRLKSLSITVHLQLRETKRSPESRDVSDTQKGIRYHEFVPEVPSISIASCGR